MKTEILGKELDLQTCKSSDPQTQQVWFVRPDLTSLKLGGSLLETWFAMSLKIKGRHKFLK